MNDELASVYGELLSKLLRNRNIHSIAEAELFLTPKYEETIHDPYLFKDMEKAVTRLIEALCRDEHITIFSDYDCDGIPGAAIISDYLRSLGCKFDVYIPHRHKEGYGLSNDAINIIATRGTKLIITVDVGITALEEVKHARELGVDIIITDHHLPLSYITSEGKEVQHIPDAYAVINTKQSDCAYPDKGLCGAATAWKFICALHMKLADSNSMLSPKLKERVLDVPRGFEKWLLDLVALATVADMVPMTGENRTLVMYGLIVLNKTRRIGLKSLIAKAGLRLGSITEDDIAFSLAPRINAASRMDNPITAFELLDATDIARASQIATTLHKLNDERKMSVAQIMKELYQSLLHREIGHVLVVGNIEWSPGVLGLIASKLVEKYSVSVFVWGQGEGDTLKGSCRSDGTVSVMDLMAQAKYGVLVSYGGHELAGGFSISHQNVHSLEQELSQVYKQVPKLQTSACTSYDVEHVTEVIEMNMSMYESVSKLSPHGILNPKPVFKVTSIGRVAVQTFGKKSEHVRLVPENGVQGIEMVYFFPKVMPQEEFINPAYIICNLEQNVFMGKKTLRMRVLDMQ